MNAFLTTDAHVWSAQDLTGDNQTHFVDWITRATNNIDNLDRGLSLEMNQKVRSFWLYHGETLNGDSPLMIAIIRYFIAWLVNASWGDVTEWRPTYAQTWADITRHIPDEDSDLLWYFVTKGGLEAIIRHLSLISSDEGTPEIMQPLKEAYGHFSFLIAQLKHSRVKAKRQLYLETCTRALENARHALENARRDESDVWMHDAWRADSYR